jgi:hypothetical protein
MKSLLTHNSSAIMQPLLLEPLPSPETNHRLRLLQPHDLPPSPLPQLKEEVVVKEPLPQYLQY